VGRHATGFSSIRTVASGITAPASAAEGDQAPGVEVQAEDRRAEAGIAGKDVEQVCART
jgi:hypothetical protein